MNVEKHTFCYISAKEEAMKKCKHTNEDLIDKHKEPSTLEKLLEGRAEISARGAGIDISTLIYTFKCVDCGRIRQKEYKI